MSVRLVVTGTDTGIGKTVAAAALVGLLNADYWKPIQAGHEGATDGDTVMRLSGADRARIHPEAYNLAAPLSPHRAAELDGISIERTRLEPPSTTRSLVIEGAGGVMVPLTRDLLQIDLFASWAFPVVLIAPTRLGTINHSLLSLDALARRGIRVAGILFVGDENADSQRTILDFAHVPTLGRLPWITLLDAARLHNAACTHLDLARLARITNEAAP